MAATANSSIWLGLVHLQSMRDIVVALDAGRVITAFVLAVYTVVFSFWSTTEDTICLTQNCFGSADTMSYGRALLVGLVIALLLTWLLDILMRTAGTVGMHARAPVLGHGGVPDAGVLIGLMVQLLISRFAVILMKSWARARVCTLI